MVRIIFEEMAVHKSFRIIGIVINYSSLPKADPWFQSFVWIRPYISISVWIPRGQKFL
jgi:hypothetical protein